MTEILKHIKFQEYYKFEEGGLKVMKVQGLMFPIAFLALLYKISCEIGSKEKIDEILYLSGERQVYNAIKYLENTIGISRNNIIQSCNFILSQTEINGLGRIKAKRLDSQSKKMLFEQETEFFEDALSSIFGDNNRMTKSAVVQYIGGGINAMVSFMFEEPMETKVIFNIDNNKYNYVSQLKKDSKSVLNKEELNKVNGILSLYTWKHMKN